MRRTKNREPVAAAARDSHCCTSRTRRCVIAVTAASRSSASSSESSAQISEALRGAWGSRSGGHTVQDRVVGGHGAPLGNGKSASEREAQKLACAASLARQSGKGKELS